MSETKAQKVVRLAEQGVEKALRDRRPFTITKLSRHEDGYLHARVTPSGGQPIYVHRRYGSWMAPGEIGGRKVMKELEAFGLPTAAKVELQRKARALERAENGNQEVPDATDGAGAVHDPTSSADLA